MSILSTPTDFHLGPGFWAVLPADSSQDVLASYLERAQEIFAEHDIVPLAPHRLQLIVMAAVEAAMLFHTAALREPSQHDLDELFADFIIRALVC